MNPVPDFLLERYRLGELPLAEREALARRVDADPELRRRLDELERSDTRLRRLQTDGRLADRVHARLAEKRAIAATEARRLAWLGPLPAGLAVAAAIVLAFSLRSLVTGPVHRPIALAPSEPGPVAPSASSEPAGDRIKGLRPGLALFRKAEEGSRALADGDPARAGDVVRLGYRALGRRFGVIVSLDGRGAVTRHLPARGAEAARLEGGDLVLLSDAYELDDAPAWECFYFVTADTPFEVATVEQAARQAGNDGGAAADQAPERLPLPKALVQSSFLLRKETRR